MLQELLSGGEPSVVIDNLLATVAAFLTIAPLKTESPYLGAKALCLTYLGYFFLSQALWSRT